MSSRRIALIALALTSAALGGCNRAAEKQEGGKAGGEVLDGSISDAMLPFDTVKSQPPLAPHAEAPGKPKGEADDTASAATSDTPAAADDAPKADAAESQAASVG